MPPLIYKDKENNSYNKKLFLFVTHNSLTTIRKRGTITIHNINLFYYIVQGLPKSLDEMKPVDSVQKPTSALIAMTDRMGFATIIKTNNLFDVHGVANGKSFFIIKPN